MDILFYTTPDSISAGTTLKDKEQTTFPFYNNMAYYVNDQPDHVTDNRLRLTKRLGIPLKQWIFLRVGHDDQFVEVTQHDAGHGTLNDASAIQEIDGMYTREANLVLSIFHADCVPMMIYAPDQNIVGVIHAGWPSTIKEITRKMLTTLIETEKCDPAQMKIWIGPSISQDHFEIDAPLIEKVKRMSFDAMPYLRLLSPSRGYMDCAAMNRKQMLDLQIPAENIKVLKMCTFEDEQHLFSYRRNKECGRHISFIVRKA